MVRSERLIKLRDSCFSAKYILVYSLQYEVFFTIISQKNLGQGRVGVNVKKFRISSLNFFEVKKIKKFEVKKICIVEPILNETLFF